MEISEVGCLVLVMLRVQRVQPAAGVSERQGACEILFVRSLLAEMGLHQELPTVLRVDNSGAVELSRDRKSCNRSRHVDRRFFKVRELVAEGHIKVEHVATELNRSDMLTKAIHVDAFERHRASLMNLPIKLLYAARAWSSTIYEQMVAREFTQSAADPSVFHRVGRSGSRDSICVFADDALSRAW